MATSGLAGLGGIGSFRTLIVESLGSILVGILINWAGMGILVHQVYVYATFYHDKDRVLIKALVYFVVICEVTFTFLLTHFLFALVISGWGDVLLLVKPPWTSKLLVPSNSYVPIIIQCFFAWRIWMFNRRSKIAKVAATIVLLLALCQWITCTVYVVKFSKLPLLSATTDPVLKLTTTLWLAVAAAVDIIIAAALVTSLLQRKEKSKGVAFATISTINKLILRAIETGVVTSMLTLLALILYTHSSFEGKFFYAAPSLCIGKFYAMMLLANLNGRQNLTSAQHHVLSTVVASEPVELELNAFNLRSRLGRIDVMVSNATETHPTDEESTHRVQNDPDKTALGTTFQRLTPQRLITSKSDFPEEVY